ncbi:MAG: hypothetical protein MUC97_13125 [Bernardetiaceae bacterium]|nr:hypothetical protein [Bernardetiaceae bacterium]
MEQTPFRPYDAQLGRFHGIDLLADMFPGITPMHFGYNNRRRAVPVMFNDPTGLMGERDGRRDTRKWWLKNGDGGGPFTGGGNGQDERVKDRGVVRGDGGGQRQSTGAAAPRQVGSPGGTTTTIADPSTGNGWVSKGLRMAVLLGRYGSVIAKILEPTELGKDDLLDLDRAEPMLATPPQAFAPLMGSQDTEYEDLPGLTHNDPDTYIDALRRDPTRMWVTYTLFHADGRKYVGRASGYGTPQQVMKARYARHLILRAEGFYLDEKLSLDRFVVGNRDAIRGREQQLLDHIGGVGHPKVRNAIRAVSPLNPYRYRYHNASNALWGELHEITPKL